MQEHKQEAATLELTVSKHEDIWSERNGSATC